MVLLRKKWFCARNGFLFCFTVPTLALFSVIVLIPILQGLYYSFFSWNGLSSEKTFVALENYKRLLADPVILTALGNDLKTAVIRLLFTLLLSLGLALILTRIHVPGNRFFRSLLFFPTMLSAVVVCTVWMMLYNPSFGILNLLLDVIGVPIPDAGWLGDFRTALYSTIPPAVWCSVGFYMIIFISAIDSIPETLFESAKMDGVSLWVETKDIILPLVRPQINFCAIYVVISSMNGSYLFVKLLTNGGPNSASEVLGTYMTTNAFNYHQFGYATAIGTLILAVTLLISGLLNKIFRSEAYEF